MRTNEKQAQGRQQPQRRPQLHQRHLLPLFPHQQSVHPCIHLHTTAHCAEARRKGANGHLSAPCPHTHKHVLANALKAAFGPYFRRNFGVFRRVEPYRHAVTPQHPTDLCPGRPLLQRRADGGGRDVFTPNTL